MARLLVIDDDENIRLLLREEFSLEGHTVGLAADGAAGLEAAAAQRPDLVILDLKMPGMGGLDVLRQLKESLPETPVFLFTAYGDFRGEALSLGADRYIVKSWNLKPLTDAVLQALVDR